MNKFKIGDIVRRISSAGVNDGFREGMIGEIVNFENRFGLYFYDIKIMHNQPNHISKNNHEENLELVKHGGKYKMKNKKRIGKYRIYLRKSLDIKKDLINIELKICKKLQSLLDLYTVKNKKGIEAGFGDLIFKRRLIKQVLIGSIRWEDYFNIFFIDELIKKGKYEFSMKDKKYYQNIINSIKDFKYVICEMESLKKEEKTQINVELTKRGVNHE